MRETQIRNNIIAWLSWHGGYVFIHDNVGIYDPVKRCFRKRNNRYHKLGVSDLIGIWKGKFLAIEVKSETGRLSQHQKIFLDEVNDYGGIGFMARSVEDVQKELKARGLL